MSGPDAESASRWLALARGDLRAASAIVADPTAPARGAVALAQQAAEKALKAVIALDGTDPPRTHDLVALWRRVQARRPSLPPLPKLAALSQAARDARYPDPAAVPYERPEADELLGAAAAVLEAVEPLLSSAGMDVSTIEPA